MKVTDKKILTPAIAISVAVLSGAVYYGVQLSQNNNNTTYAEVQNSVNTQTPENAPDDYVVKIPDDNLRNTIKSALNNPGMPDSELTFAKLKTIKNLTNPDSRINNGEDYTLPSISVANLDGLQFLTNLEQAYFRDGSYTDLSPLENLTNLKNLRIARNPKISDISKLSKLVNLEHFEFFRNSISDISVLKNMPKLKYIVMDVNQIEDISVMASLPNLKIAYFSENKIKDFSPLKNASLQNFTQEYPWAVNTFSDQQPEISVYTKIFENPIKGIDGAVIPVNETATVKNVDQNGNPNQNGGYLKLETSADSLTTSVGFSKRVTTIINPRETAWSEQTRGVLKINFINDTTKPVFNTQTPSKIIARKGTDISAKIAEISATDAESGMKSTTNNAADINLNIANPAKGKYTLKYTATDNNNNSETLNREVEIVDADELNLEISKRNNKDLSPYTAESITKYKEILANAKNVFNNPEATQEQIDKEVEKIKNAESVLRPDKSKLKDAIITVGTLEDWFKNLPEVIKAKEDAQKVVDNQNATPEEIKKAEEKLAEDISKARKNEEKRQQDAKTATNNAETAKNPESIQNAQDVINTVKNPEVKQNLQKALDKIKKDLSDKKDELQKLIEKAKSTNLDGKTKDSSDKLKDEITKAENILNGTNSSQSEIEKEIEDLTKVLGNLKTDKKPVLDAIKSHDSKPDWIKKSQDVIKAFEKVNNSNANQNPSVEEVRKSAKDLIDAIDKLEKTNKDAIDEGSNLLDQAENDIKLNESKPDELPAIDIDEISESIEEVLDPVKKEELKERLEKIKLRIQKKKESIDKKKLEEAERIAREKIEKSRMLRHPDTGALRVKKQQNQENSLIGVVILGLFSILSTITALVLRKK